MPATRKVVVVGLDGLEPKIVDRLLQAGELPNLARLRASGGYGRVATTLPAQTPVAWSTFSTGTNPGGHGIYDFLRRDPDTYAPDLSFSRFERRSVLLPPKAVNLRRGTTVWELLASEGIPSTVLRMPCTFPPDTGKGRMLAGMGVPDLRGGLGTSTLFTTRSGIGEGEAEQVVQLTGSSPYTATLPGPRRPKCEGSVGAAITIEVHPNGQGITIQSDGRPRAIQLSRGIWSDWLRLAFTSGPLQTTAGMVRFLWRDDREATEVYASPVNFDPASPPFPISRPWEYANELTRAIGCYHTTGMIEDHAGLTNGRLSEEDFLQQCQDVLGERERMLQFELNRHREGLLFCLFDTPDRLQHMFWRFTESSHPANRHHGSGREAFASVIDEHYRACDAIVGRAMEHVDEHTLFVVLSDHGFASFRRGVHLNAWLHAQGLLTLKHGTIAGAGAGASLGNVDWGRTKAYALGLGSIYLNLKGREGEGIVPVADAEGLAQEIARGLSGLRDDSAGTVAIRGVSTRREVYSGAFADESPDLVVRCAAGYRASWSTALGGVAGELFEDNTRKWGGDHIVDPELVPGVLFMNRPFQSSAARMVDLAPTILGWFGVSAGAQMEGASLIE
ncbi:MAG: alkaline phosphatase family protein [Gemmatimonadaceae bacterium]